MNNEQLKKEWEESELNKRISTTEMFAINHGFPEWHAQTISEWWLSKLSQAVQEERERIVREIEGMKGLSKNPSYFIELKRKLEGNIAMENVDNFQLTQISWEAKDLIIEDIIKIIKPHPKGNKGGD